MPFVIGILRHNHKRLLMGFQRSPFSILAHAIMQPVILEV